jgi:hypothetical protein
VVSVKPNVDRICATCIIGVVATGTNRTGTNASADILGLDVLGGRKIGVTSGVIAVADGDRLGVTAPGPIVGTSRDFAG